jgi:predicted dehydrogenase
MPVKYNSKPQKVLRGALLGCGHIAPFHMRAWEQIENADIVAIYNRTVSKADALARNFGISPDHVYGDYLELFEKEDLDFVDIATAPHIHRILVEAAARHGLHILCQKPFALTLEDAKSMISVCEQEGVLFTINENWRWRSWYRKLKSMINENIIGHARYIRISRHDNLTLPLPNGNLPSLFINQPYTVEMNRLIVYEWGIHLIDVLRFLFGEITSIYAKIDKVSLICKGEDRAYITLEAGGVICLIDISWSTMRGNYRSSLLEHVTIEGDQGTIELIPDGNILRITTEKGAWEHAVINCSPEEAYQASYTAAHQDFIKCLREKKTPETNANDNIKTFIAALAVYKSAAENQVINMGGSFDY